MCSECEKKIHISILVFTWTDHVRDCWMSPNVFSTSALLLEVQNFSWVPGCPNERYFSTSVSMKYGCD